MQTAAGRQAALNGDPVALISVLDYIVSQISPLGGVFDMLQTLKLGEHLGLTWYDNIIGGLQTSQYFPQLAQAVGDFANTINDLSVLKQVGQLDDEATVPTVSLKATPVRSWTTSRKSGAPRSICVPMETGRCSSRAAVCV